MSHIPSDQKAGRPKTLSKKPWLSAGFPQAATSGLGSELQQALSVEEKTHGEKSAQSEDRTWVSGVFKKGVPVLMFCFVTHITLEHMRTHMS